MFDFHSHVLPNMDDGAQDTDTALLMLQTLKQQGVESVVLTPHFYPSEESATCFLARRQRLYALLCEAISVSGISAPSLYLGAEVLFERYCTEIDNFYKLVIGNSPYMLIEVVSSKDDWLENQLSHLYYGMGIIPIMAHIERYTAPVLLSNLSKNYGGYAHVNCSSFLAMRTRHRTLNLIKKGHVDLLCSDCHNMDSRSPDFSEARTIIFKKLGANYLDVLDKNASQLAARLGMD